MYFIFSSSLHKVQEGKLTYNSWNSNILLLCFLYLLSNKLAMFIFPILTFDVCAVDNF